MINRALRALALTALATVAAPEEGRAQQAEGAPAEQLTTCTPELKTEYKALDRQLVDGCFAPAGLEAVCTEEFLGGVVGFLEKVDCKSYNDVVTECADSVDLVKVDSYVSCESGLEIINRTNCMSFWLLKRFCE